MKSGKIKIYFVLLITGILISESSAQEWIHGGPWSSNMRWLKYSPHDTTQVFGAQNYYWISEDGGLTWSNHFDELPEDISWNNRIKDIVFHPVSPDIFWLVADVIIKTVDGGNNWTVQDSGMEELEIRQLCIRPDQPDTLFAVTGNYYAPGYLYRSIDGGESWTRVADLNLRLNFIRIDPSNNNRILACMVSLHSIMESLDGGDTFQIKCEYAFQFLQLEINPEDGQHLMARTINNILRRSFDGGEIWGNFGLGDIRNFHLDSDWNIYVLQYYNNYLNGRILKSTDGGANWTQTASQIPLSGWVGVYPTIFSSNPENSNSIFIANEEGLFLSHDGGETVNVVGEGLGYTMIFKLLQHPENQNQLYALNMYTQWLGDVESGEWIGQNHYDIYAMAISNELPYVFYIAGDSLWKSEDGGSTYESILSHRSGIHQISIHPTDSSILYCGWPDFFRSEDQGETWDEIDINHDGLFEVDPNHPDWVYMSHAGIYLSTDTGLTWNLVNNEYSARKFLPLPSDNGLVIISDSSGQYGIHYSLHLLYTNDDCENFELISSGLPNVEIRDIEIRTGTEDHLFAATDSGVYHTQDYGETWTYLEGPYEPPVRSLAFTPDGTSIHIGTDNDGIWSGMNLFESTSIYESKRINILPSDITLYPVYPNPSNSSVSILFDLPMEIHVNMNIYDLNGRLVHKLIQGKMPPGTQRVVWNEIRESSISSGAYYINLKAGSINLTRKMIILK